MAHKIFLSYTDAEQAIVGQVAQRLKNIFDQVQVFYDSWAQYPGESSIDRGNRGLEAPEFMFLFVSKDSLAGEMVNNMEWQCDVLSVTTGQTSIILVRFDDSDMTLHLLRIQSIDMPTIGFETVIIQTTNLIRSIST